MMVAGLEWSSFVLIFFCKFLGMPWIISPLINQIRRLTGFAQPLLSSRNLTPHRKNQECNTQDNA